MRSASSPSWRCGEAHACERPCVLAALSRSPRAALRLDRFGQADLVVLGQQRVWPMSVREPDEVFYIALDTILGHATLLHTKC